MADLGGDEPMPKGPSSEDVENAAKAIGQAADAVEQACKEGSTGACAGAVVVGAAEGVVEAGAEIVVGTVKAGWWLVKSTAKTHFGTQEQREQVAIEAKEGFTKMVGAGKRQVHLLKMAAENPEDVVEGVKLAGPRRATKVVTKAAVEATVAVEGGVALVTKAKTLLRSGEAVVEAGTDAGARLSNAEVRAWYSEQVKSLDTSGPLTEETAARIHAARNVLKQQARDMMADRAAAEQLAKGQPLRPLEYHVQKYSGEGYEGEALWERIIKRGTTPNEGVNKKFNVE